MAPSGRMVASSTSDFFITFGEERLLVRVRRHPRARRLRLRYDAALGELKLVIPPRAGLGDARRWVEGQSAWIERQRAIRPQGEPVQQGSVLPWRGGTLTVCWSAQSPRTPRIDGDRLCLGGPQSAIGRRIRRWMEQEARQEFAAASQAMADRAGLKLSAVSVGDPRSRWGSCTSTGRIRYNWRLVMAPDHVRLAIVAHEVAHLAHLNHGPAFYDLVHSLCGDAHDRSREWLRHHGSDLHRWRFDGV
ncbi:M48 family metallopeptidase [Sphingomonas lacunae]|nr:SprT family zinc-dependent metalloprotease [Sphingomonas lacunae]